MIIIDNFAIELLTKSYNQYSKTGDSHFEFIAHNGDELFYYSEAAKYLAENKYIEAISENILADEPVALNPVLSFEILPKGIEYLKIIMH